MRRALVVALLSALLCGCGQPVPPDKLAYVGEWETATMYLLITADGSVRYRRLRAGATTSLDGPLKGFAGDNFDVGVGPLSTTFVVSRPPYQDGDAWKMVVDGVELTRTGDGL
jgi:hypothetical protein